MSSETLKAAEAVAGQTPQWPLARISNVERRFIESENSNGFHAPQEATRILGESINFSRKGQVALRGGVQQGSAGR